MVMQSNRLLLPAKPVQQVTAAPILQAYLLLTTVVNQVAPPSQLAKLDYPLLGLPKPLLLRS